MTARIRRRFGLVASAASVVLATHAWLGAKTFAYGGDPAAGLRIARQWCASCHIVAPGAGNSDAARPFQAIAGDPNFTRDGIRTWLADPHPPMPNLSLSRAEADDIVAYLMSLRGQ